MNNHCTFFKEILFTIIVTTYQRLFTFGLLWIEIGLIEIRVFWRHSTWHITFMVYFLSMITIIATNTSHNVLLYHTARLSSHSCSEIFQLPNELQSIGHSGTRLSSTKCNENLSLLQCSWSKMMLINKAIDINIINREFKAIVNTNMCETVPSMALVKAAPTAVKTGPISYPNPSIARINSRK